MSNESEQALLNTTDAFRQNSNTLMNEGFKAGAVL